MQVSLIEETLRTLEKCPHRLAQPHGVVSGRAAEAYLGNSTRSRLELREVSVPWRT